VENRFQICLSNFNLQRYNEVLLKREQEIEKLQGQLHAVVGLCRLESS
jgi:hypothetical protein